MVLAKFDFWNFHHMLSALFYRLLHLLGDLKDNFVPLDQEHFYELNLQPCNSNVIFAPQSHLYDAILGLNACRTPLTWFFANRYRDVPKPSFWISSFFTIYWWNFTPTVAPSPSVHPSSGLTVYWHVGALFYLPVITPLMLGNSVFGPFPSDLPQ